MKYVGEALSQAPTRMFSVIDPVKSSKKSFDNETQYKKMWAEEETESLKKHTYQEEEINQC